MKSGIPLRTVRRWAIAVIVPTLLTLSGCALGEGSGSGGTGNTQFDTVEAGKLTFAVSSTFRPFSFYNEKNELVGFDVEIGKAIADRLGLTPNPVTGAFDTHIAGLMSGRYDAVINSMTPTEQRRQQADFSQPYYSAGGQLFVTASSPTKSADDLRNATVGVPLGTTYEKFARGLHGVREVETYQNSLDMLRDLENGRLDAAITSKPSGLYTITNAGLKLVPAGGVLFPEEAAIPVAKGNDELLNAINQALTEIKNDRTFSTISEKWFGHDIG